MTLQEFIAKWTGQTVDTDGVYPNQCMDLMHEYVKDVLGFPVSFLSQPAAKDVFLKYPNDNGANNFTQVFNTPSGVPQPGDIVFWGANIGQYGHVAVFVSGNADSFTSFDANWPLGSKPHLQTHNYNGVLGWFHPKAVATPAPQPNSPTMSENDQVVQMLPGLHLGQFKTADQPTVYSILKVPDPHWETDIFKQPFAGIAVLPAGFPIDANQWTTKDEVAKVQAALDAANKSLSDATNGLSGANATINNLKAQVASLTDQLTKVTTTQVPVVVAPANPVVPVPPIQPAAKEANDLVSLIIRLFTKYL